MLLTVKRLQLLATRSYSTTRIRSLPPEHEFKVAPRLVARCPKSDQPLQHLSCTHHLSSPATAPPPNSSISHSNFDDRSSHRESSHRKTMRRWNQLSSDSRCTKVFASQRALDRHLERHSSHRFVCSECSRRFTEPWSLRKHKTEQHGYDFSRRSADLLRQRASSLMGNAELGNAGDIDSSDSLIQSRLLSCPECNDEFLNAKSLADHVAREGAEHSTKRPRVTFESAADLQNVFVRFSERSHDGLATRSENAPRAAYFSLKSGEEKIPTMHFHPISAEPGELVASLLLNLNSFAQTHVEYKLYLVECMPQNTSSERATMRVTTMFAREDAWEWCESQNLLELNMFSNPILSLNQKDVSSSATDETNLETCRGMWSAASRFYTRELGWRHVKLVVSVANGAKFAARTFPKWLDGAHVFTENGRTFCPSCNDDFHPYEGLFEHHSETTHHVCWFPNCGKQYASGHSLAIHERSHMGDRAFKCSFCDEGFWDPAARFAHERIHEDERHAHDCRMCSKSFQNLSGLFNHKWVHMGKIDYVCPEISCTNVFGHPEALRHHVTSSHGDTRARRALQGM